MPTIVLEAMANGVPVIGSNIDGVSVIFDVSLPIMEWIHETVLSLPIHSMLSEEQLACVCVWCGEQLLVMCNG